MSSLVQTLKSDFLKTMNRSSRQRFGGDLHLKLLLCTFHTDFSFFHLRIYFCGVRALRCHVSFGTRQFLFISHYSPWIITSYPPEPACWRKKSTPLHHQESVQLLLSLKLSKVPLQWRAFSSAAEAVTLS